MSQNEDHKTKKQFKSQSVNSLFRQQATGSNGSLGNNNDLSHLGLLKKKSSNSTTKLKLVSKKVKTINSSRLEKNKAIVKESSPSPPPVWTKSESPEVKNAQVKEPAVNNVEGSTNTKQDVVEKHATEEMVTSKGPETTKSQIPEPHSANISTPEKTLQLQNFNWADDDEDNIWLDLQNQIQNETKPAFEQQQKSLWSSPNPKLSSFRKSTTPTISSLNQSPLITSTNEQLNEPNDIFLLQSRQSSNDPRYISQPPPQQPPAASQLHGGFVDEPLWSNNNLWNIEDRQLSTKSDSTLLWSPFDQHKKDGVSDDSLKSIGLDSQTRHITSRFFPSPQVEQENSFTSTRRTPIKKSSIIRSKSIDDSISDIIKLIDPMQKYPNYLQTYTYKSEEELFPEHFHANLVMDIPVSFPGTHTTQQGLQSRLSSYITPTSSITQEQYYPEGFASTFYKRGINNFMFVRELQPKLITSKARNTVEIRVSLPSINTALRTDEDVFFKMRCYIIDVGLRDLNGKSNGYKLSQKAHNGHGGSGYGRSRFGSSGYRGGHGYKRN